MARCRNCGKWKFGFLLSSDGLCFSCAYDERNRQQAKQLRNRSYHVVGTDFYKEAVNNSFTVLEDYNIPRKEMLSRFPVGSKFPKYDTKIKYPAQLIPEPTNPHDKNAIKVLVNGNHIGYIDRDTAARFDAPLKYVTDCYVKIKQSPYKEITQDSNNKLHATTNGYLDLLVTLSFH